MVTITVALTPIFAMIVMGFILRHQSLIADEFWIPCERLNYFYLFPALMFTQVASADFGELSLGLIAASLLGAVVIGALLVYALHLIRPQPGPVFSSVLQGALRPNTYVGVAAATALFGQAGLMVTAVAIAITIPLLNIGSICLLAIYGDNGPLDKARLAKTIATNPVILSIVAGALTNWSGLLIPEAVSATLTILGRASFLWGCSRLERASIWRRLEFHTGLSCNRAS